MGRGYEQTIHMCPVWIGVLNRSIDNGSISLNMYVVQDAETEAKLIKVTNKRIEKFTSITSTLR
jgi:hypothetical protein